MDSNLHEKLVKVNEDIEIDRGSLEKGTIGGRDELGSEDFRHTVPEEHDNFYAFVDDLDPEAQSLVEALPDTIDILPPFVQKWKVSELWAAIRDR